MAFVPEHAPAVVLALLAAAALGGGGLLLFVGLLLADRPRAALRAMGVAAGIGVLYAAGLASVAVASSERVLEAGRYKYFCEIDCHFAVALTGVVTTDALGEGVARVEAEGRFHVVTVRAWFDERTISSRRAREIPLHTPPRRVRIVDAAGGSWLPSAAGQRALGEGVDALDRPLRVGEAYEVRYVFDLPESVQEPRLLVEDRSLVSRFVIGHENSPFHGKVLFDIG